MESLRGWPWRGGVAGWMWESQSGMGKLLEVTGGFINLIVVVVLYVY